MKSICGCECRGCPFNESKKCAGCSATNGCPFGTECFIAKYIKIGGIQNYNSFKAELVKEFNELDIPGMPKIKELTPLNGSFVNLEYILPNNKKVKFLNDNDIYLGTQVECEFNDDKVIKCYGLVANPSFLLVSEYGENGSSPELIIYKKR